MRPASRLFTPRFIPTEELRPKQRTISDNDPFKHKKGRKPAVSSFKAYCLCGKKMMPTTPKDVKAGIQPLCKDCPPRETMET